ncbi:MAG: GNAT family N-acetyltransferase, partial [Syntrophorhabdus sp.]
MPEPRRNNLEYNGWCIRPLTDYISTRSFNCGRDDLNEFFQIDLPDHERYLLTKTYSVTPVDIDESFPIVALISFCNDKIYLESVRDRIDIPEDKRYRYLPAVKIARLGVYKDYRGKGIGSHVINVAKKLFLTNNR